MIAEVMLWGRTIAVVSQDEGQATATFQYTPEFARSQIQVSPLTMPLREEPYSFPSLPSLTFHGLPGLLADSLPDRFGNALINAWLAREGRPAESFSAIERLCYVGTRGMGALEFRPAAGPRFDHSKAVQIDHLVELANQVMDQRQELKSELATEGLADILRVGTSAGGARAKAVIAWNPQTNEVRSGQVKTDPAFEYWLLKFDGVHGNRDKELADPQGFGAIEFAYSQMARDAGIEMTDCRLWEENGRRHFMTQRFDRRLGGAKRHMQSLCGLAHFDFNQAGAFSYEQALSVIQRLNAGHPAAVEQFRRMVFNVVARNQDDHVKNIAFLMDQRGNWTLSPAFDVTYSYNPSGAWTSRHQMQINGKTDGFTLEDLLVCARSAAIRPAEANDIIDQVIQAVRKWPGVAESVGIPDVWIRQIQSTHRLMF